MTRDKILQFVKKNIPLEHKIVFMARDASLRSYARVHTSKKNYIVMDSSLEPKSMECFLKVCDHLSDYYSVPEVISVDRDNSFAILEDLGEESYTKILNSHKKKEKELYENAVKLLVDLHKRLNTNSSDFLPYSDKLLIDEANILIDWYYPLINGKKILKKDREEYVENMLSIFSMLHCKTECFVLRDYHADNLMWLEDREGIKRVGLLDFQDAVIGSCAYDLVSLLEDARRDVDEKVVKQMIDLYINASGMEKETLLNDYYILGAQRNSKILGIFARKFMLDGDPRYLHFLPRVISYLYGDLKHPALKQLKSWFERHELLDMDKVMKIIGKKK